MKDQDRKLVVISPFYHKKLTLEMAKQGRTRKAIAEDALRMYIEFKESERLLNRSAK